MLVFSCTWERKRISSPVPVDRMLRHLYEKKSANIQSMCRILRKIPHRAFGNFTTIIRIKTASFLINRILFQSMRKEACQVPLFSMLSMALPAFLSHGLLIHPDIVLVSAWRDQTAPNRIPHCTSPLLVMSAATEPALIRIRCELAKCLSQFFFWNLLHLLCIQRGKTRCIRNKATTNRKQFHMPGSMPTTAQLFADLTYPQGKARMKCIENTRFSNAGIARKGRNLSP